MINEKDDISRNKDALNYEIYVNRLRKFLSENIARYWDIMYKTFENNGYKLRNSYIFNNKYDNNSVKINSNIYLKRKSSYNKAKEKIKYREIMLINANYKNINIMSLPNLIDCDIVIMSNISDYIKNIYNGKTNYLESYIKDIIRKLKNNENKIVCAYLYNIQNIPGQKP